jgi:predicted amidophosphoribosyltransferase
VGAEWSRSAVGDLVHRLKYRGDLAALRPLVEQAQGLFSRHPELLEVDALVPVPASTQREVDPVRAWAGAVGEDLSLPVWPVLVKTRQTALQKEMRSLAQKRANVRGAFAVKGQVHGKRLLLLDDLFDSGATLEEATRTLLEAGAARVCVLAVARTIHTDA